MIADKQALEYETASALAGGRRPRRFSGSADPAWKAPLLGALGAGAVLTVTAVLVFRVQRIANLDGQARTCFWLLQRPGILGTAHDIANSANALPVAVAASVLVGVACHTRRPVLIAPITLVVVGANLSTQALKAVLPGHTFTWQGAQIVTGHVFPSGHATASMSLALCTVVLTPCRGRGLVAGLGAFYALAMGYTLLVLSIHSPSDVIAGYLMAGIWALLGVALLRALETRWPIPSAHRPPLSYRRENLPLAGVLATALGATAVVGVAGPAQAQPTLLVVTSCLVGAVGVGIVATVARLSGTSHTDRRCPRALQRGVRGAAA